MEPRPPRPRATAPGERSGRAPGTEQATGAGSVAGASPGAPGLEGGAYGPATGPPTYAPAGEIPLVPRQQRRRQRLARGALLLALLVAGLGAAGYVAADRFLGEDDGDGPGAPAVALLTPTAAAGAADGTPRAASGSAPTPTTRASVAQVVATPTPTPGAAADATEPAAEEAAPTRRAANRAAAAEETAAAEAPAGEPPALEDLLPTADEAAPGFTVSIDPAERPVEEVVDSLGTADALETLEALGWEQNSFVQFQAPDVDALQPGSTTTIDVSIHRFADAASAAEALTYFSDAIVSAVGFEEIRVDPIGEEVRALTGVNEQGVAQVIVYVQIGPDMARISGTSNTEDGDPTPEVVAAAEAVAAKAA